MSDVLPLVDVLRVLGRRIHEQLPERAEPAEIVAAREALLEHRLLRQIIERIETRAGIPSHQLEDLALRWPPFGGLSRPGGYGEATQGFPTEEGCRLLERLGELDRNGTTASLWRELGVDSNCAERTEPPAKTTKRKKSTSSGDALTKIVSVLTEHHQYAQGSCLNQEPIGVKALARLAKVAPATASGFFLKTFKGHTQYQAACRDKDKLINSLKLLNNEFAPHILFSRRPPNEGHRDHD